jgi:hypothetical protein
MDRHRGIVEVVKTVPVPAGSDDDKLPDDPAHGGPVEFDALTSY